MGRRPRLDERHLVNGSKLKKGRIAKVGDVIKIGATELRVQA